MRIIIDGDACCVTSLTEEIAHEYNIECHIYSDTAHQIEPKYSNVIIHIMDKGPNSVDFAIANACCPNDIIITNDVGLAALILSKKGFVISPFGIEFTNTNIMSHMNRRFMKATAFRKQKHNHGIKDYGISKKNGKKPSYKQTLMRVLHRVDKLSANICS